MEGAKKNGIIIEERIYDTNQGMWVYFTDQSCFESQEVDFIGIGTLESYAKIRDRLTDKQIIPLYVYTDDSIRLERAMNRERQQITPDYKEMCRRFLADEEDFSEMKLREQRIVNCFENNLDIQICLGEIKRFIAKCRNENESI